MTDTVHVARNGIDRQVSGFRMPVQGDCVITEVKTIVAVQMARICLRTTALLDLVCVS